MPTYPRVLRALLLDGDAAFVAQLRRFAPALNFDLDCRAAPVPLVCLRRGKPDLLLIDPATAGTTGWDYLAQLYEFLDLSLVVCSAPVSREQRVCGLRRGVDAWLTKPMHPLELLARIEAVARGRRWGLEPISERLAVADVLIRPESWRAPRGRCCCARRSTGGCGATRWRGGTARSTSWSNGCGAS